MKAVRIGICLLITFAVLAHGVVEVWSASIFEMGSVLLLVIWSCAVLLRREEKIQLSPLLWPLEGLTLLGIIQLAFGWTVQPYLTRSELLQVFALLIIFFLASQAFRKKEELRGLVWFLLFLCFAVSLFGVIQFLTSNGKLYWFRPLGGGGDPFGPYVNRNHFAGFVELIVPTGLALLVFRGLRRDQAALAGLFAIIPIGALVFSATRGGIAVLIFEVSLLATLMWLHRAGRVKAGAAAIVLLAAVALVAWLGVGKVLGRLRELRPSELPFSRRISMAHDTWKVFVDHPLAGTGLGTLVAVYPSYATFYDGKTIDHAHNDYLELLADAGIAGGLCGLAFLFLLFHGSLRNLRLPQSTFSLSLHAGGLVATTGILVHSLFDFNLHLPANAMLFLLQAHLASLPPFDSGGGHRKLSETRGESSIDNRSLASPY
ncbi:MAG: O-antigen ligase family protein [Candidatus Acidiferrales bacterium]